MRAVLENVLYLPCVTSPKGGALDNLHRALQRRDPLAVTVAGDGTRSVAASRGDGRMSAWERTGERFLARHLLARHRVRAGGPAGNERRPRRAPARVAMDLLDSKRCGHAVIRIRWFGHGADGSVVTAGSAIEGDADPLRCDPIVAPHIPVMVEDVVLAVAPLDGALVIDGTFGAGGYARAFLDLGASVIGLDRDPAAHAMAAANGLADHPRLTLHEMDFARLDEASDAPIDAVVLDIGVSSMQIDRAERGFSFMRDGPLDMRMGADGPTAADVVNRASVSDLTRIIGILGEERHAPRVARAIDRAREQAPIETTGRLASVVETALGRRPGDRIHPATRTFQALRIHVNDELGQLARALAAAERALKPGGRLAVVTFHSLEDRMVKRFLADRAGGARGSRHMPAVEERDATFEPIGRQGRGPSEDEMTANPRSRSARLRAARRTDAPARGDVPTTGHDLPSADSHGAAR